MLPTLWPGDVVRIENGREISAGDIVLAERENCFVVHRIVGCAERDGRAYWITRGDARPSDDQPLAASEVLGRVAAVERGCRLVIPSRHVSRFRQLLSWTLCHCELIRRIALRVHAGRRQQPREAAQLLYRNLSH
jgi:hypothetical protein